MYRQEALLGISKIFELEKSKLPPIALFTRQPWANLIVNGRRRVMVKNWDFPYRGPFLIHSAWRINASECERLSVDTKPRQAFVGGAELVETERVLTDSRWRELSDYHLIDGSRPYGNDTYIYYLKNTRRLKSPIHIRGRLSGSQWGAYEEMVNADPVQLADGLNLHGWEPLFMRVPYKDGKVHIWEYRSEKFLPLEWE